MVMRKILSIVILLISLVSQAQIGRVALPKGDTTGEIFYWNNTTGKMVSTYANKLYWDATNSNLKIGTTTTTSAWLYINGAGTRSATTKFLIDGDINATKDSSFVITSAGYVGIGTTNPSSQLHVSGSIRTDNNVYFGGAGYITNTALAFSSNGVVSLSNVNTSANSALSLGTYNLERMRITPTGLIGIGTTSPTTALQVSGGAIKTGVTAYSQLDSLRLYTPKVQFKGTDTTGVGSTANIGHIMYYNGHFYGLIAGTPPIWKQLDN